MKPLEVKVGELHCTLTRIDDRRYAQLAEHSLAIQEDHAFLMDLILDDRRRGIFMSLGEFYFAFKEFFGESGRYFDDYKGAFSFPFEVTVHKGRADYAYVLNFVNWRSTVEFRFSKVISPDCREFDRMRIHPPFSDEFSAQDMNKVVAYLYGFAQGVVAIFQRLRTPIEDFFKKVDSNWILFGFRDGGFFENQFEDTDEFLAACRRIVALDSHSGVSDQFKLLRTRIFHRSRAKGWNTIQVTGFNKGEGKTLVATNLAVSIAQDARQTSLLVDLDLRSPSLHQLLGLKENTPGLKSYFQQGEPLENLLINPGIDKLTVLLAGGRMADAPELMGSPRMEALVKELKSRYPDRYIIFDSPPINECPDPVMFSEYVDAMLLVARADRTSLESIQAAMKLVPHQKVLGLVLNDSRWEETQNYYYYGYSARG